MQATEPNTEERPATERRRVLRPLARSERVAPPVPASEEWADDGEGPIRGRLRRALLAVD
jgi:hypothetical protein